MMKKLLIHACCGPCTSIPIIRLQNDYEIAIFFSNSNIFPEEEYEKRLETTRQVARILNVNLIEDEYDHGAWLSAVHGLEKEPEGGKRCEKCFEFRLQRTLQHAISHHFPLITTTLSISPHKKFPIIKRIGEKVVANTPVDFLAIDFKKKNGFKESVSFSKQHGIYRQNYCGCEFSIRKKASITR
ncbi:MAG: epoxyqueuosine reductase QueH [Candidatus Helarchaeales archaeon]